MMPSPFTAITDQIVALLRTAAAGELGITEDEVSIQSLNFDADQRVAILYEPISSSLQAFENGLDVDLSFGTLEIGVYSRAFDDIDDEDAATNRSAAIAEVNDLAFVFGTVVRDYRNSLRSYSGTRRLFDEPGFDSTIGIEYGWIPSISGTTLRHRVARLTFQIPFCIS